MNFNYKPKFTYSFRRGIFLIFSALILTFILVLLWVSTSFTYTLRNNTYEHVHDTLEVYNQQLTHNLDKLHIFMYDMTEYSLDMTEVFRTPDLTNIYNKVIRTKMLLDYSIPSFTEIDGMFVYAPVNDSFIPSFKYDDGRVVTEYLKATFRETDYEGNIPMTAWYSKEIDGAYYLIRIIESNGAYIGAWSAIDRMTSIFEPISELEGNIIYIDQSGKPLSKGIYSQYNFSVSGSKDTYQIIDTDSGEALLVMNELSYCDYYLGAIIPLKNIDSQLSTLYRLFTFLAILMLAFTIIFLLSVTKFLSKPIRLLEGAAKSMRKGNFDHKIPEDTSNCQEIIEIDQAFNQMIDEIQHLRIDIYEENIAKTDIELQYLKAQIAPHFLINVLYSISTLAKQPSKDHRILDDMITSLSDHLRYTLSGSTLVSLSKEMSFVSNYIELTQLRFPGCLTFRPDIEPDTLDGSVFPLILLMLTENTIKYNMVMGEMLDIEIKAYRVQKDQKTFIHLTHIDSGQGFPQDTLDDLNHLTHIFNQTNLSNMSNDHLGIPNVAKRLRIVYDQEATISFSNEDGAGARIDIEIPYIPFITSGDQKGD